MSGVNILENEVHVFSYVTELLHQHSSLFCGSVMDEKTLACKLSAIKDSPFVENEALFKQFCSIFSNNNLLPVFENVLKQTCFKLLECWDKRAKANLEGPHHQSVIARLFTMHLATFVSWTRDQFHKTLVLQHLQEINRKLRAKRTYLVEKRIVCSFSLSKRRKTLERIYGKPEERGKIEQDIINYGTFLNSLLLFE